MSFAHFTFTKDAIPFVEMTRKALKKESKRGKLNPEDFCVLNTVKCIIEINTLITHGHWMQAAILLIKLSCSKLDAENEAMFNIMLVNWKMRILEYAAVIVFLLKFGVAYLPDYCLSYIDYNTDFEPFF